MDYEKKYKEVLNKAKKELQICGSFDCDAAKQIFRLFPELKENKDERIRKEIISILKGEVGYTSKENADRYIAWLEKQSEQKPQGKTALNAINEEKIDNANKVDNANNGELRFHIRDWIVTNNTKIAFLIKSYNSGYYTLEDIKGNTYSPCITPTEENYHLWTIQDAKDGDVLAVDDETIVIFKDLYNATTFHSYCHIEDGVFTASEKDVPDWWEGKGFHPATKEQRDTLMKAMANADYKWDAEKKQLRKMEHDKSKFQILKDAWYVCTCTTCTEDSRIWFNNGTAYLGSEILKYDLGFEPEEYQNYFRLWSINDAKPGDILASKDGKSILIFRHFSLDDDNTFLAYYSITFSPYYNMQGFDDVWFSTNFIPATKEQCDLLLQKMTEAGYEYDVEKEQLRTIEMQELVEEKPIWSVEDEKKRNLLIDILNVNYPNGRFKVNPANTLNMETISTEELVDWLKSLKPQNTWKLNDEHYELEEFAKIVRSNLTGISKAVQELFEAKYLQLTGNKMYGGFKD